MRMRQIVLICGLGAALMAGMAQAIERHEGYQVVQVESQALAVMPCDLAPTVTAVAAEEYEGYAPLVTKADTGVGEGASNTERMRQHAQHGADKNFSVASVTSQAKAPEDPGEEYWI